MSDVKEIKPCLDESVDVEDRLICWKPLGNKDEAQTFVTFRCRHHLEYTPKKKMENPCSVKVEKDLSENNENTSVPVTNIAYAVDDIGVKVQVSQDMVSDSELLPSDGGDIEGVLVIANPRPRVNSSTRRVSRHRRTRSM